MYALESFYVFFEVGDDLTGPKASKVSSRKRRRGRSIRFVFGLCSSSVAIRVRWTRLGLNKAIGLFSFFLFRPGIENESRVTRIVLVCPLKLN